MKSISILIGAANVTHADYYLRLFNNQTSDDFRIIFLSKNKLENTDGFDFEFQWIKEECHNFLPNIKRMRHAIYKNELLLALEQDSTEYVLFFDAFQIPSKFLIEEHLKYLKQNFSVIGSRIEILNKAEEWTLKDKCVIDKTDPRDTGVLKRISGGNAWNCNSSFKYADLIQVNGFDMEFSGGGGGEDCDLGERIERLGAKFLFNPRAKMWHPNHDRPLKLYYSNKAITNHDPKKFRSAPWDIATSGDDSLLEDEYLKCFYTKTGIKRWRCKKCGEEGLVESFHVLNHNRQSNIVSCVFGLNELKRWMTEFKKE